MRSFNQAVSYLQIIKSKKYQRRGFAAMIILLGLVLITPNLAVITGGAADEFNQFDRFESQAQIPTDERERLADPRGGITIVTDHREGNIVALNPNGTLLYYNDTHDGYWDVDPSPEGSRTVLYSATDEITNSSVCKPVDDQDYCIEQMIKRENLTTGETTVLYSRIDPRYVASEWHDVDRINDTHFAVADMYQDEVFIINVKTGIVTWEWGLQNQFSLTTGNQYPRDWAHLNDVEILQDGRIMISPRNQDQILFINRTQGVDESWTIGSEGEHEVLFEQHNPDYIPRERGGPAVVIADSENNRIVEYQRTSNGEWNRSWIWQDRQMQWPRDADRLPNGHTLIADTGSNRIIEVNQSGDIVWQFDYPRNYEVERLNTGDESTGGQSALEENLTSVSVDSRLAPDTGGDDINPLFAVYYLIKQQLPNKVVNGLVNGTPVWMKFPDILVSVALSLTLIVWVTAECYWSTLSLQFPVTRQ
jgi:hypothetical protein